MATTGNERRLRYLLLLWEGGTLVLHEILAAETDKTGQTLETLLKANEGHFRRKTDKQTFQKIFPSAGIRDTKTWDISLLATVILMLFKNNLTTDVCNEIRKIKELRNELAHIASLSMEEDEYDEDRKELAATLMKLTNGLDRTVHDKCQHFIKDFSTGPIDINSANERVADLRRYDELISKQFEILTGKVDQVHYELQDIKQMLRSVLQLEEECSTFKVIGTEMVLRCPSNRLIKLAEESIIQVFKAALKRTGGEEDITKLAIAVRAILSDIENCDGVEVSEIEKHCIKIIMKCKTCKGLLELLEYIESERLQQRLLDLSSALAEMFDERFTITAEIADDSLEELLKMRERVRGILHQPDEMLPAKKQITVTDTSYENILKYSSEDTEVETEDDPSQDSDTLLKDERRRVPVLEHGDSGNNTTTMTSAECELDTIEDSLQEEFEFKISTDYDEVEAEDVDIPLREYQKELAKEGEEGENVIVMAPTNTGKTRVACRIMQVHLRRQRQSGKTGKVIFLVDNDELAFHQGKVCAELLPAYRTKVVSGSILRSKKQFLWDFLDRRDILVVTADVLPDAIYLKKVDSIAKFSMIVFDECHLTIDFHPFNETLSLYMDLKLRKHVDAEQLPQIIGLTGFLWFGDETNNDAAMHYMKIFLAHLDAKYLCTVRKNKEELKQYRNYQTEEIVVSKKKSNDRYRGALLGIMDTIDNYMITHPSIKTIQGRDEFIKTLCRVPACRGTEQFIGWLSDFKEGLGKLRSDNIRRMMNPCRIHLEAYNKALLIHADARIKDAEEILEEFMGIEKVNVPGNDTDVYLLELYKGMTKCGQKDVLDYFKGGRHKIIILTSIAEEGLDITKCNFIIRYEHVTNEIVRLQSRGRARQQDSRYYVLTEEGSWIVEIEEKKALLENVMNIILPELQVYIEDHPNLWERELREMQEEQKLQEELQQKQYQANMTNAEREFRCLNCNHFICFLSDIRKIQGAHHVVVDEGVSERLISFRNPHPRFIDEELKFNGAIFCGNPYCQRELGGLCEYKHAEFPLLKIKNFRVVSRNDEGNTFKQWKKTNFEVEPFTLEDLRHVAERRRRDI
ncbi:antiviral innate immune response receptor RIG-I-like isoform X2 [Mercenaria mercenaria]|uniref:antiviral innate immune response receptor RIG-I-like isoform X2 n=1 Tax=Mercenaria mercenaria TaxID=6596 RepID=UPI00234E89F9|nr:antiviral innate immune response receptor RIG-I-like isoform X2 [Mercenaria mercenaria]